MTRPTLDVVKYNTMEIRTLNHNKLVRLIREGKIGVLPTDTIYGIHASIFHPEAVEKIYKVRKRDQNKPFVVLVSSLEDLNLLKIKLDTKTKNFLDKVWPGKISVILPVKHELFSYLHRGKNSLAIRMPDNPELHALLVETGPMVSTSVNPQGKKPATTIQEAEGYFGDKMDFYVDAGQLESEPSTLVELKAGKVKVIREGAVKLTK